MSLEWQDFALCAQTSPDMFFPEEGASAAPAKKICAECTVREICLQYALDNDRRYGVWGGLSAAERQKLRKAAA